MSEIDEDKNIKAVEKVLGEPAFAEFTENTWRIRTNLILASIISIAVVLGDLHIESGSSIFGLKFEGLDDSLVRGSLLWVLIYLLIHFLWSAFDSLNEWRLRVTGTRVAWVTAATFASEEGDYPGDPRKSTLYNWWKVHASRIGNLTEKIKGIETTLKGFENDLNKIISDRAVANEVINICMPHISTTNSHVVELRQKLTEFSNVFESKRIPTSLKRFDLWFQICLRSQNLRWLVVEFSIPILLGIFALLLLSR